ncbi:MAG TPA: Hpt domain-containing protein, partial [Chloroflexota bacterium]|nr:Hpt domain-containing protein [Chloroflexota bacterium]
MQFDATEEDLQVWFAEADENLEYLQNDVINLEKDYTNSELVDRIFRAAHTLKGSSAMIGHHRMAELTHAMESVFGTVREGKLTPTAEVVDALLQGVDGLSALREEVVTKEERTDVDLTGTVAALVKIVQDAGGQLARMPGQAAAAPTGPESGVGSQESGDSAASTQDSGILGKLPLDDGEQEAVKATIEAGVDVFLVEVAFQPDSEWLAVRSFQILTDLSGLGELLKSIPSGEDVEAEKVLPNMAL